MKKVVEIYDMQSDSEIKEKVENDLKELGVLKKNKDDEYDPEKKEGVLIIEFIECRLT